MNVNGDLYVEGRSDPTIFHLPDWIVGTDYIPGDMVLVAGKVYVCIFGHQAATFALEMANWTLANGNPLTVITADPPVPSIVNLDPLIPVWRMGDDIVTGDIGYIYDYGDAQPDSISAANGREMVFKVQALEDFNVFNLQVGSSTGLGNVHHWFGPDATFKQAGSPDVYGQIYPGMFTILESYYLDPGPQGNTVNLLASNHHLSGEQYGIAVNAPEASGTPTVWNNLRFSQVVNMDWDAPNYPAPFGYEPAISIISNPHEVKASGQPKLTFAYASSIVITHYNLPAEVVKWRFKGGGTGAEFPVTVFDPDPSRCEQCYDGNPLMIMDGTVSPFYSYQVTFDPDNTRFVLKQVIPAIPPTTV